MVDEDLDREEELEEEGGGKKKAGGPGIAKILVITLFVLAVVGGGGGVAYFGLVDQQAADQGLSSKEIKARKAKDKKEQKAKTKKERKEQKAKTKKERKEQKAKTKKERKEQKAKAKKEKKEKKEKAKKEKKSKTPKVEIFIPMNPPLVINFTNPRPMRFLQIQMEVLVHSKDTAEDIKKYTPIIRNNLMIMLSGLDSQALMSREGKEKVRAEILEEIKAILKERTGKAKVEQVYFTGFVMQ